MRLTPRGRRAWLVGVLCLAAGLFTGTPQIYQLAYALLALTCVAPVFALRASRGVSVERRWPPRMRPTAGCQTPAELVARNDARATSFALEIVHRLPGEANLRLAPLPGGTERVVTASAFFEHRGPHRLGSVEASVEDPFGFARVVRRFGDVASEVLVYPRLGRLEGVALSAWKASGDGGSARPPSPRGDEFEGLREYRRGDELRHVHWKGLARTGQLLVKEHAAGRERRPRCAVVLDLCRPDGARAGGVVGDRGGAVSEVAVSAAASVLGDLLLKEGCETRLICNGRVRSVTPFGSGEDHFWRAMELLARAEPGGAEDPEPCWGQGVGPGGRVVIVAPADAAPDSLRRTVRGLGKAGTKVAVLLVLGTADGADRHPERRRLERAGALVSLVPGDGHALLGSVPGGATQERTA